MAQRIRILFIDDNPDDARLLQRALEGSGYDVVSQRVATAPELEAALDRAPWDVVLADDTPPHLDAPHALAIVRARLPDTPFIIISGTIGEETVLKCMRDGANDFFVKGKTALLPHAIEREMESARLRRLHSDAERELRDAERRLAHLFSSSPVPYSVTRIRDNRIVEVNDAYAQMTGYSRDEMIGNTVADLGIWVFPEQRAALIEALKGPLPVRNFEFKARTRSGELGDILLTADIIDFHGEPCVLSMALDITERKRAEEGYRFQAKLLNAIGQSVVVNDMQGNIIYWNYAAEALHGWTSEEAIGRFVLEMTCAPNQMDIGVAIYETLASGNAWTGEIRGIRRDGSEFPSLMTISPLTDSAGAPLGGITVAADISQLKQVQEQLRVSEALHRAILNSIFDAVFMIDDAGRFTFVGPSVEAVLGYTPDEVRAFGDIHHLFGVELVSLDALDADHEFQNVDARFTTKSGEERALSVSVKRVTVGDGTILYVCRDITDRLRAMEGLRRSELRFRMITENARDLYVLFDSQGRCMYASPAYQRLLHYDPQGLIGINLMQTLVHPEDWGEGDWHNMTPRRGRLRTAEGDWLWVEGYTYPVQLDDGEYIVGVGRDISERLQLEEERLEKERLRIELEQQKELSKIKSRFVSMVSHEFRTPLTTIQTSGDLLKHYIDRMTVERRDEHLSRISDQVQQLTHLLDEVLIISKADSVGLAFNPMPVDVRALVDEVVTTVEHMPGASGRIMAAVSGHIQAQLDLKLFRQVLNNLLVNALKYSDPGTPVRLDARVKGDWLVVQVEDQGIGIPEADLPHLFEAFQRASNVGAIAGTGLGLAIVKRAIDSHGGSISVASQVGSGTLITVRVPVVQPAVAAATSAGRA